MARGPPPGCLRDFIARLRSSHDASEVVTESSIGHSKHSNLIFCPLAVAFAKGNTREAVVKNETVS